jgi:cellulose synthase/poly-beta-1,6-N-acetylglucosamine synthase-like glycosyltransferase
MIVLLSIPVFALLVYYCWFVLTVRGGLGRMELPKRPTPSREFISVIIAVRNEEGSIERCLRSVLHQNYPADQFEVIVVDDNSTDSTAQIVHRIAESDTRVRLIQLDNESDGSNGQKPKAIAVGVQHARGTLIATTDGDCFVSETWLQSMADSFGPEIVFVAGPVFEKSDSTVLNKLESLEFFSLIVSSAGLIGAGNPIICNGANLMYRKSAFRAVNGFGESKTFCDDETLMQRIVLRNVGKVRFCAHTAALVETHSDNDFKSFWHQRVRWAAKKGHYENPKILVQLVLLYSFFLFLLVSALASLLIPELRAPVIIAFAIKIIVDWAALSRGARLFKHKISTASFFLAEVFHAPYIVAAAAMGQLGTIQWKNRKIRP